MGYEVRDAGEIAERGTSPDSRFGRRPPLRRGGGGSERRSCVALMGVMVVVKLKGGWRERWKKYKVKLGKPDGKGTGRSAGSNERLKKLIERMEKRHQK